MFSPRILSLITSVGVALLAVCPARAEHRTEAPLPIKELRAAMRDLTGELRHLIEDMQIDLRNDPESRQLIQDGAKVLDEAQHLTEALRPDANPGHILRDFEEFDAAWHHLADQLRGGNRTRHIARGVAQVDRADQAIHDLLGSSAGLDRLEIGRLAGDWARAARHLLTDIEFELRRTRGYDHVTGEARQFVDQTRHFAEAVRPNVDDEHLLRDFQQCDAAWHQLRGRLAEMPRTSYVFRSTQRVERVDESLHQLLVIPDPLNRERIAQLSARLADTAGRLARDARDGRSDRRRRFRYQPISTIAEGFAASAEHFSQSVQQGASSDHLRRDFAKLDQSWQDLDNRLRYLSIFRYWDVHRAAARVRPLMTELRDELRFATEPPAAAVTLTYPAQDLGALFRELGL
jgi:exonuclease VII large subunit